MNTKAHVLVIDDDATIGRSFERVLEKQGYVVDTVLTGRDGLDIFDTNKYDAVFTDIKMPDMDGMDVAEEIKKRNPRTPITIITGFGSSENKDNKGVK